MSDLDEKELDFRRDAHPSGRLIRIGVWVAMALAFALQDLIGFYASLILCLLLLIAAVAVRDKTPVAAPNDGFFWRIAAGERARREGRAPEDSVNAINITGRISMAFALGGVVVSAFIGPPGLGLTLAYVVVSVFKYRILANLGAAAA